MKVEIDNIKYNLEIPERNNGWESYFATKSDHYEILAFKREMEIKRLNKIIDKLIK